MRERSTWTTVYLVRHGQTPLNESGALRGLLDPALDETGREQARRLGEALGSRGPALVVASRFAVPGRPRNRSRSVPVSK